MTDTPLDTKPVETTRSRLETKADATTAAARAILDEETARREAKTARLRAARLAMEEENQAPVVVAATAKRKTAARKAASGARLSN